MFQLRQINRHLLQFERYSEVVRSISAVIVLLECVEDIRTTRHIDNAAASGFVDKRTYFKPTETFQHTFFTTCHPPGVKKGFVKGEALRLLGTNSSKKTFQDNIKIIVTHLMERGYLRNFIEKKLKTENGPSFN